MTRNEHKEQSRIEFWRRNQGLQIGLEILLLTTIMGIIVYISYVFVKLFGG